MSTFSQTLRVNPDLIPQDYGPQSSGIVDGSQAGIFLLFNLSNPGVPNFVGGAFFYLVSAMFTMNMHAMYVYAITLLYQNRE